MRGDLYQSFLETITTTNPIQYFTLILICTFFIFPQSAFSDNNENLKLLRERIHSLQKDLSKNESLKKNSSNDLQQTERAISNINRELAKLVENDRKATEDFKQLQTQFSQIKSEIDTERMQLEKLLYQQYVGGHQDYLRTMLNLQDPNQIARELHYYKHLSLAFSNSVYQLQQRQTHIDSLVKISQQKREEIATIRTEYATQQKNLEQKKKQHQLLLSQISEKITLQQQEINQLKQDEKRIEKLVREINKVLVKEKSNGALVNNSLPNASHAGVAFSTLKGKLILPVQGKLLNRFGGQRSGKQVTWKGLFIQSPNGSKVKAVSDGQIVFASWLRGFGNLMIIDHGNGYMSLYGNNEILHKQVGDKIRGGDTIATVGNSGTNPDSGLYFELRHKGKPFDPLTWVKVE